jgi:Protein of unknown function (DUF3011)
MNGRTRMRRPALLLAASTLFLAILPEPASAQAGQRSAQSDCTREVERRGFTVLSTGNFQQSRDGWQLDVRARDFRGRVTDGTCFVETRTGDVSLYGFGWGGSSAPGSFEFTCASKDERYRECQLPIDGRARLVKRRSDAPCTEGRSWGQKGDRVWVDRGCRATFEVVRGGGGGSGGGVNPGQRQRAEVQCRNEARRQNIDVSRVAPAEPRSSYWFTIVDGTLRGQAVRANCRFYPGSNRAELAVRSGSGSGSGGGPGGGAVTAERACLGEAQRQGLRVVEWDAARPVQGGYSMRLQLRKGNQPVRTAQCTYRTSNGQVDLRY